MMRNISRKSKTTLRKRRLKMSRGLKIWKKSRRKMKMNTMMKKRKISKKSQS